MNTHTTSGSVFHALRAYFLSQGIVELSRFEMELISRATGSFCYSACASSSNQFQIDFYQGSSTGDTMDTYTRFLGNELDKGHKFNKYVSKVLDQIATIAPNVIVPKSLYMDMTHILRYPFDGSVEILTSTIKEIINFLLVLRDKMSESDQTAIDQAVDNVTRFARKEDQPKHMALVYDLAVRMEIDLNIFQNKIYRILDINEWNTYQQAKDDEDYLRKEFLRKKSLRGAGMTEEELKWYNNQ